LSIPSVIAIDGPVASGKTTVGLALAERLGYRLVDTGAMYRAVTHLALSKGVPHDDVAALAALAEATHIDIVSARERGGPQRVLANGVDVTDHLRTPEVESAVSIVSKVARVRDAMVEQQRRMADEGRTVMVGRDIGTVVLRAAGMKVFLVASVEERAKRRFAEVMAKGGRQTLDAVRENLAMRDKLDSEREVSPLRPAEDAIRIDTDPLTIEQVVERILRLAREW